MLRLPAMLRFSTGGIEDMVHNYVGRLTDLPPDALPGAAKLADLPATAIVVSECDDPRPSGDLLAVQLEESGVPVQTYVAEGMLHGENPAYPRGRTSRRECSTATSIAPRVSRRSTVRSTFSRQYSDRPDSTNDRKGGQRRVRTVSYSCPAYRVTRVSFMVP
jgi:acetyl esterase/lipase